MKLRLVDKPEYVDEPAYDSFEDFVNRDRIKEETDELSIIQILQKIQEKQQEMRYYLNEIELFIPRNKDARFKKKS